MVSGLCGGRGTLHELSPMSNNLNVALYRDDKTLIEQQLLRIDVGAGHGVFNLPDSLPSGKYVLRAHTGWMKNFGEGIFL